MTVKKCEWFEKHKPQKTSTDMGEVHEFVQQRYKGKKFDNGSKFKKQEEEKMTPLMKFHHDYYSYRDKCERRETIALIIACVVLVIIIVVLIVWRVHK